MCKCDGKITKIVATACQILRQKCTKFDCGYGAPSQTQLGELTALFRPRSWINGPTSNGSGKGWERGGRRHGSGSGGMHAPFLNSWICHWLRVRYGNTRLCHASTRKLTDETRRDSDQRVQEGRTCQATYDGLV